MPISEADTNCPGPVTRLISLFIELLSIVRHALLGCQCCGVPVGRQRINAAQQSIEQIAAARRAAVSQELFSLAPCPHKGMLAHAKDCKGRILSRQLHDQASDVTAVHARCLHQR
jgi:hypothetical protein